MDRSQCAKDEPQHDGFGQNGSEKTLVNCKPAPISARFGTLITLYVATHQTSKCGPTASQHCNEYSTHITLAKPEGKSRNDLAKDPSKDAKILQDAADTLAAPVLTLGCIFGIKNFLASTLTGRHHWTSSSGNTAKIADS